jgi:GMP synthase (glutamine-hydrolysing)
MDKIIILDMGGQYAHLLARRVRQLGVYSEIMPSDTPVAKLKSASGIIISGGPASVYEKNSPKADARLFALKVPILGLCYGHQLMAQALGGEVHPGKVKEYGIASVEVKKKLGVFSGLEGKETVWMSHGDSVAKMPAGFAAIGSTPDCSIAAMGSSSRKYYGLQFHPEVTHTRHGMKILSNFVLKVCRAGKGWGMGNFIRQKAGEIRKAAGKRNVFLLVSGGVDSTVCFALLNRALGAKRVYGLHIDNGFMRQDESRKVGHALKKLGFSNFHAVDASRDFLLAVEGIVEPEEKRKIIGETFIRVQQREVKRLRLSPKKWMLGQGTIYPDTIETKGTRHADLIKTHHNRVEAVRQMIRKGLVIEPIKELYKDEVRELGLRLGLPHDIVFRHPFPGPGLAVRCLCSDGKEGAAIENEKSLNRRIGLIAAKRGMQGKILPIRSVGVQGDSRTYRHPVALAGDGGNESMFTLEKLSTELTNRIRETNRVVLLVTGKDFGSIGLKKASITRERLDLLREADAVVQGHLDDADYRRIWQFPVVLVPLTISGGESIVLRPVESKEAMTANWARLPWEKIMKIARALMKLHGIDMVFYDVTNKPPATIEWE